MLYERNEADPFNEHVLSLLTHLYNETILSRQLVVLHQKSDAILNRLGFTWENSDLSTQEIMSFFSKQVIANWVCRNAFSVKLIEEPDGKIKTISRNTIPVAMFLHL